MDENTRDAADPRFAALPTRPGKIIAVHLSYAARADQRGRRPAAPSYFLKPSSSVAASGSAIERPEGAELLAFEGEIALVIGTPGRRIPLAEAWSHVGWVTAANDFGLYDLRENDKGSNVRSKGGDGYTPLGPQLIDARSVDPVSLRVRTWVNGGLVQDDTAKGLIFPLEQFVADLSQHFTLETGDVILTGTPAQEREVGWRRALTARGARVPEPFKGGDWSARTGYDLGRQIVRDQSVTAVFCANDHLALGLVRALQAAGRRVPEQVSVIGFDDIPDAEFFGPALTTVRQDFDELGRRALLALIRSIGGVPGGRRAAGPVAAIDPSLVVRASTARPAS